VRAWSATAVLLALLAASARAADHTAAHHAAAKADVQRLLASVTLPGGAQPAAGEPAGDRGYLKPAPGLSLSPDAIDVYAFWRVPGSPTATLDYVQNHPPAGARLLSSRVNSDRNGPQAYTLSLGWPPVGGALGNRQVNVTTASLGDDLTGVLVQAESVFREDRPTWERVPSGIRLITIAAGPLSGAPTVRSVAGAGRVRRLIRLFDGLPVAQPVAVACPVLLAQNAQRYSFGFWRGRTPQGRPAAAASYVAYAGPGQASGPCNAVSFSVGRRSGPPLIGGELLQRVDRITGP
jgi:hypothetical protein